jgi:putative dehydrogenase
MNDTVGVVGLGIMGGAFAQHLAAAGVRTLGYDLLPANVHALVVQGGEGCSSARAVAREADVVITSLPHAEALEDALFGADGIVAAGRPGILVVETSTLPLEVREKARSRLAAAGISMLDAPVSGTGGQAKIKDISVFASGERTDYERARGVLSHLARSVRYVGSSATARKSNTSPTCWSPCIFWLRLRQSYWAKRPASTARHWWTYWPIALRRRGCSKCAGRIWLAALTKCPW